MPTAPLLHRRLAACLTVACAVLAASPALATPKTICTITVNSADEKETFRRNLPPGDYKFVELVERGRPDWLASACQQRISCDALIISGHFDGGDAFYTDSLATSEFLAVEEMERASCSQSCPGVFSQLKEVYLFGCNTLKPEPAQTASGEIVRGLTRSGRSPAEAAQMAALLGERHAESNRDRMRRIFKDVPVVYGFSSKAPLGRYAGPLLERFFQSAPPAEIGSGQVNARLLALFAPSSMTVTTGVREGDVQAGLRRDTCELLDDRLSPERKVAFVHEVLRREPAEARLLLGHLEHFVGSLGPAQWTAPKTSAAFQAIAADTTARDRYLEFARDADEPAVRTRMMAFARKLGWLTPQQEQAEFVAMLAQHIERGTLGRDEVDLACSRQAGEGLAPALQPLAGRAFKGGGVAVAAALACMGSADAHGQVLRALTSATPDEIAIAQAYLRHRPLADAAEIRGVVAAVGRMSSAPAQLRALETLAQQRLPDADTVRGIAALFPQARSLDTQRAIARILIRADHSALAREPLARSLRQTRFKSPDGEDVIDALIRVLQAG